MLGSNARPAVARFWAPVVARLARAGVTADMVTITGTVGAVASAVFLIGTGHLFWGAFTVTVFVLLDMLDGALARARGGGSVFGAVLDSVGDRAADAAIFGALVWWYSGAGDNRLLVLLALICLVLAGTGLYGLGLPYAVHVGLWLLLAGSVVTVVQRGVEVHRQASGRRLPSTPAAP